MHLRAARHSHPNADSKTQRVTVQLLFWYSDRDVIIMQALTNLLQLECSTFEHTYTWQTKTLQNYDLNRIK